MMLNSRGLRNCNPCNIRRDKTTLWQGESPLQTDPDFVIFVTPEYGIRAAAKILYNYQRDGATTLRQMISRWAPPSDNNDTVAYIATVSNYTGIDQDAQVNLATMLPALIKGMIYQENGQQPYSDDTIMTGIGMA